MGAALTYARRYALFTMVGIAGEDDLDAPDMANDGAKVEIELSTKKSVGPVAAGTSRSRSQTAVQAQETLNAEASAVARAQLIQEIQTLPDCELQPRAITILKNKNRLLAEDAKLVEQAFAARVAVPDASAEASAEPASPNPMKPQPPTVSAGAVKRARGRPRKTRPPLIDAATPPIASPSAVDDGSEQRQADAAPAKIDKSKLTFGEPRRLRDKAHLKFVASLPCLICGRSPTDAHHLRFTQPRAMGLKVSDEFTVPLCRIHHRENHNCGNELAWWEGQAIDPLATSRMLWVSTRRIE